MKKFMIILSVLIVFLGLTTVFIVDETEQVVILQLGKPVRTITEPGLNIKVPFPFQEKITFDDVLMTSLSGKVVIGKPVVKNSKVIGEIEDQYKGPKVRGIRYKNKTRAVSKP